MRLTRLQLQAILYLAGGLWIAALILSGTALPAGFYRPVGVVIAAVLLVVGAFETLVWRLRILHPWFVATPVLRGTWRGELSTMWIDPVTGQPPAPALVFLVVRQTLSRLSVRLLTQETASTTLAADICPEPDGVTLMAYVYRNEPPISIQSRSPVHRGAAVLRVYGDPAYCLEGDYWTDRDSKGIIRFDGRSRRIHFDYTTALADTYTTHQSR